LGAWKHEYDFDAAYYIRPKAYLERSLDGRFHNAIAGVPVHMSGALEFTDMEPGTHLDVAHGTVSRWSEYPRSSHNVVTMHGKLNPKPVPGGIVLQDIPFELKL
jgi:hypothetical protein